MKKRYLLVMAVLVVAMGLAIAVPASACTQGCTPGYWKQPHHFDSWVGYAPDDYFDEVFGVGQHIKLIDALWLRGGGENALMRHAVAALLNAAYYPDMDYISPAYVSSLVQEAYFGSREVEDVKDELAAYNELGCPLN